MTPETRSGLFRPDHILFAISQPQLSRKRELAFYDALAAASPLPALCVRLEGAGISVPEALDQLHAQGAKNILVQPVGLPFSEIHLTWLPGALAHWLQTAPDDVAIRFGNDMALAPEVIAATLATTIETIPHAMPLGDVKPSLGPRGWDEPGEASDHILVCTGPRCHFRDAPRLRLAIADALRAAGALRFCEVSETSCLGPCNRGPLVTHYPDGTWYTLKTSADVRRFVDEAVLARTPPDDLVAHRLTSR